MSVRLSPTLWGADVDAKLAPVPLERIDWIRTAWAVHHQPVPQIALAVGLPTAEVERILAAGLQGRSEVGQSVYASVPWPLEAAEALAAARAAGIQRARSYGEGSATAKLTAEAVVRAREAVAHGMSVLAVATHFKLHHSTVADLVTGRTWRHVGGPIRATAEPAAPPVVEEEDQPDIDTGTGRLQQLDAAGQVLGTYDTVVAAERATGVAREAIAAAANSGQVGWRYEPVPEPVAAAPVVEDWGVWGRTSEAPAVLVISRRHR